MENSAISLSPSFASFVNSTETLGDVDCNDELVFHNEALLKIMGLSSSKEVHAILGKAVFVSRENGNTLSMLSTANSRFSDTILSQQYTYRCKTDSKQLKKHGRDVNRSEDDNYKIISFIRNEIIFDGKKCIVINVRNLTEQEWHYESKTRTKELHETVKLLTNELQDPIEIVAKTSEQLRGRFAAVIDLPSALQ